MREELELLSRRSFLRASAGAGAAALSLDGVKAEVARALADVRTTDSSKVDDGYWRKIREQFLLEEGFAYLNTGTVGATPGPVYHALVSYWRMMAQNPNESSAILQGRYDAIRAKAAAFVGADASEIAIVRNATEGNNLLAQGLDLKAGDEVLIGTLEHDSSRQPWRLRAQRHGIVVREVPIATPPGSPEEIARAFESAVTPRTRVVSLAHCDTVTGTLAPVAEVARAARARGLLCFVDGAQTLGMVPIDLHALGVDAYVMTCHKWLASPAGTGLLYLRRDLHDRIWPNVVTENWWTFKDARKYDRLSRRPWPVVAALEDALDFQNAIGRDRIAARVRALSGYLRSRAAEIPGVRLYTSNHAALAAGMTSLTLDKVSPLRLREHLRQRYDVYTAERQRGERYPADPHGVEGIRVSTHYYNTFEQVDLVLEGLRELSGGRA